MGAFCQRHSLTSSSGKGPVSGHICAAGVQDWPPERLEGGRWTRLTLQPAVRPGNACKAGNAVVNGRERYAGPGATCKTGSPGFHWWTQSNAPVSLCLSSWGWGGAWATPRLAPGPWYPTWSDASTPRHPTFAIQHTPHVTPPPPPLPPPRHLVPPWQLCPAQPSLL